MNRSRRLLSEVNGLQGAGAEVLGADLTWRGLTTRLAAFRAAGKATVRTPSVTVGKTRNARLFLTTLS